MLVFGISLFKNGGHWLYRLANLYTGDSSKQRMIYIGTCKTSVLAGRTCKLALAKHSSRYNTDILSPNLGDTCAVTSVSARTFQTEIHLRHYTHTYTLPFSAMIDSKTRLFVPLPWNPLHSYDQVGHFVLCIE